MSYAKPYTDFDKQDESVMDNWTLGCLGMIINYHLPNHAYKTRRWKN